MSRQLVKILEPGEMLSFRFGMEDITLWRKLWKIVKLLIQPFGWLFPNELAVMFEWWLLDDRWDPWAFAVTDSRILVRHSLFRRRYLDMRLAEIVDILMTRRVGVWFSSQTTPPRN